MSAVDVTAAAEVLGSRLGFSPEVLLVLGSGLSHLMDAVEDPTVIPFEDVPGFPSAGVVGHAGKYVGGTMGGRRVLLQAGRFHLYEGYSGDTIVAPVRIAHALGVHTVILTNAAGGANPAYEPGDLVLLDDHINLMAFNPLTGPVRPGETRFPDMSRPYDPALQEMTVGLASSLGTPLHRGVYAAVSGPSFETRAEVRMLRQMGADVIGMSTVPEAIVCSALGLRCLAFSLVTNKATGLSDTPLDHEEVLETGARAGRHLGALLKALLAGMPAAQSTGAK